MGGRFLVTQECSRRSKTHGLFFNTKTFRRNLALTVACAVFLSSALASSLLINRDTADTIKARAMYTTHDPIYIASDSDWAASGFPGEGTEGNPYLISGYDITGVSGDAINIQGTTVHYVIEDCYLHGDGYGIYLMNAENGTLTNNNCSGNAYDGILLTWSGNLSIVLSGNIVTGNGWYGVDAYAYPGDVALIVADCNISGNTYDGIYAEAWNNLNLTVSQSNVTFNGYYGIEAWSDNGDINAVFEGCNVSGNYDNGMYIEASNRMNMTLVDTEVTGNWGSGIEAYADYANVTALVDGCNVSDNGWTGLYLWAQANLNLTMNNSNASGDSWAGGWSAGIEAYASDGDLQAALIGCNLSYNGNEGLYAEANYNLNLTMTDCVVTWNDVTYGYSCGIEAYAYNGDLNMSLSGSVVSDQADQGIYLEASNNLYLTMNDTGVLRNYDGDYGGNGIEAYAYNGDVVAAMDGCNVSGNYGDGLYIETWNNINLTFAKSTVAWNDGYGVDVYTYSGSVDAVIDRCNISSNYYSGIYLQSSYDLSLELTGSDVSWNGQTGGGYGYGIETYASNNMFAFVNWCNVSSNYLDGIYLPYSEYSVIANSTFWDNGASGMNLNYFDYGTISNNTCRSNAQNGISLYYSTGTLLMNNTCADNGADGMGLVMSIGNDISWNLISRNLGYGLGLYSSTGNYVWNNTFLFNRGSTCVRNAGAVQGFDDWVNYWNVEGSPHGWGNFWSDWWTPDEDDDGIVDEPYLIDGGASAQDSYPLASPTSGFTKKITGIVRDFAGNPLSGANVVVTMMDGETVVSMKSDQTDSNGTYEVSFPWLEWDVGYSIEVTAIFNGAEESNSTVADATVGQEVNVTYPYEIPQFGSLLGLLLAAALVGVTGVVLLRRRHQEMP